MRERVRLAILALACTTVADSALAQGSATIAGRVDLGLQHVGPCAGTIDDRLVRHAREAGGRCRPLA